MIISNEMQALLERLKQLPQNQEVRKWAKSKGLDVMNVAWEDNARNVNSSVGPCISDLTLLVGNQPQPIIRPPNFADVTFDMEMAKIPVVVGNDRFGEDLKSVSLTTLLSNLGQYCNNLPPNTNLYAPSRDSHALVSAQACFLPVRETEQIPFSVSLYNYQSRKDDPCVLVLVCTSKGTSAQIVDSATGYRGQLLYFNKQGQRCFLEAQRLKDNRRERGVALEGAMSKEEKQDNVIMVIQIPLRQKAPVYNSSYNSNSIGMLFSAAPTGFGAAASYDDCDDCYGMLPPKPSFAKSQALAAPFASMAFNSPFSARSGPSLPPVKADMEDVIVRLGQTDGPFPNYQHMKFERDDRFPVRVTLQFYKATGTGAISYDHVEAVAALLLEARSRADFCGSLVTEPSTFRPTNPSLSQPPTPQSGAHPNVNCDQCRQPLATALRFKCLVCPDFDLCALCESSQNKTNQDGVHTTQHPLLAIRNSSTMPATLLTSNRTNMRHTAQCTNCGMSPIVGLRYRCTQCTQDLCEKCELLSSHAQLLHTTLKIAKADVVAAAKPAPAFSWTT